MKAAKIIFVIIFAYFLIACALLLRPFGSPTETTMDEYFIKNAQIETASNNVVASIVFDYRGLDTLGEATVLFAAVSGIILLFRGGVPK